MPLCADVGCFAYGCDSVAAGKAGNVDDCACDGTELTVKVVLVFVAMGLAAVLLGLAGVSVLWAALLPVAVGLAYLSLSRPTTQQEVTVTSPRSDSIPTTESANEVSNVAFSEALPTWKGWSKEVGTVTVSSSAVTVTGRKTILTVIAPFTAELLIDQKYMHWPMVKLAGTGDSGQPSTVYLVVRGAPAAVMAAPLDVVKSESEVLALSINDASAI